PLAGVPSCLLESQALATSVAFDRRTLRPLLAALATGACLLMSATQAAAYESVRDHLLSAMPSTVAHDVSKVALVIGNASYPGKAQLTTAAFDASEVAGKLAGLGFSLVGDGALPDLSLKKMRDAFDDLAARITPNSVAVIYYAGHALQLNQRNFLVPAGLESLDLEDIPTKTFDVGELFDRLRTAGGLLNVVILDACRNDPLLSSDPERSPPGGWLPGLAKPLDAPPDTVVAFATDPGKTTG